MDDIKRYSSLSFSKLILKGFLFTIIFFLISMVLLLIISAICFRLTDPTSKLEIIGSLSLYLSCAIASFAMTKLTKEKWLLGSLVLGAMIFLSTLMICIPLGNAFSSRSLLLRSAVILVSVACAFLGRKKAPKKRRKFKHKIKVS